MRQLSALLLLACALCSPTRAAAVQPPIQALGCAGGHATIEAGGTRLVSRGLNPDLRAWATARLAAGDEIAAIAFTPDCRGGLVVVGGGYIGRRLNLNGDRPVYRALDALRRQGRAIRGVAFDPFRWSTERRFVILHDRGFMAGGLGGAPQDVALLDALNAAVARRGGVRAVAFAPRGGARSGWTVVSQNGHVVARGIGGEAPTFFETIRKVADRGDLFVSFAPDAVAPRYRWTFGDAGCHQSSGARMAAVADQHCVRLDTMAEMWRGFMAELRRETGVVDFPSLLRRHEAVGATVVMVDAGRARKAWRFGLRNKRLGLPTDSETLYPASSMTKMVAGLAFAVAHEDGDLPLDKTVAQLAAEDPDGLIAQWVENEFTGLRARRRGWLDWPDRIDVGRLLRHRAALDMHGIGSSFSIDRCRSLRHLILGRPTSAPCNGVKPLKDKAPGEAFDYSGGGYLVAEAAYLQATGRPLRRGVADDVLRPARMSRSFYWASGTDDLDIARGCRTRRRCPNVLKTSDIAAPAGLVVHPEDYARLVRILMMDGVDGARTKPERVFTRRTLSTLFSTDGAAYGLGVQVSGRVTRGGFTGPREFHHGGADSQGFKSGFIANRFHRKAIVFFINGPRSWRRESRGDRGGDVMADEIESAFRSYLAELD